MSRPTHGDIIVAVSGQRPAAYDVRIEPGPPQLTVSGRELVVRRVCEFASRNAVNAWWADDGSFRLLASHRSDS